MAGIRVRLVRHLQVESACLCRGQIAGQGYIVDEADIFQRRRTAREDYRTAEGVNHGRNLSLAREEDNRPFREQA